MRMERGRAMRGKKGSKIEQKAKQLVPKGQWEHGTKRPVTRWIEEMEMFAGKT